MLGIIELNIVAVLISKSLIGSYVKQCNKQRITTINERRNNKFLKLLRNTLYKYDWYKQKNVRSKWIGTIASNDKILWLNKKNM